MSWVNDNYCDDGNNNAGCEYDGKFDLKVISTCKNLFTKN